MKPHSIANLRSGSIILGARTRRGLAAAGTLVVLRTRRVSTRFGAELRKIKNKNDHARRLRETFVSNAAGLLMGMLSAQFVGQFFAVRSVHNFWGLFSTQTFVSENAYRTLCFSVEFFVALIVFTLTDHFIDEYWSRRSETRDRVRE
jgi:hypothetical protein